MPQGQFSLGPVIFNLYGFLIAISLFFLYFYAKKFAKDFGFKNIDLLFYLILPFSLIGARLYHVISWWGYYRIFPIEIFFVWQGGLGIFGAIAGGLAGVALFFRFRKKLFLPAINLLFPPMLLSQAIGRLGNFFNKEAFGPPTNLPWKIFIPVSQRPIQYLDQSFFHPTFLYESLLCAMAFGLFFFFLRKRIPKEKYFPFYLISYGLIRFFTEFYRLDTFKINNLKIAFFISGAMVLFGIISIISKKGKWIWR